MTAALYRISYLSTAHREMSRPELDQILATARENNPKRDVTGVLIYHDMQFFQTLEGAQKQVEEVFARIKRDGRHSGCIALEARPVSERMFSRWFMAFRHGEHLSTPQKDGLEQLSGIRNHYTANAQAKDDRTLILVDSILAGFRDVQFA